MGTVGAVVVDVAVPLVAGAREPPVVVVVSWPRRYRPSSVPPHPAVRMAQTATRTVAAFALRFANRLPPGDPSGTERCSLPTDRQSVLRRPPGRVSMRDGQG